MRLLCDQRGATIVEFAMIVLPFFALLIAILQATATATAFAQQTLETASEKTVRQLLTGQAQGAKLTKPQFKQVLCTQLPSFMTCDNVLIDVRNVGSFGDIDRLPKGVEDDRSGGVIDATKFDPGLSEAIVVVHVMYAWNVTSGPLGFNIATMSGGRRLLSAVSVFKSRRSKKRGHQLSVAART